MARYQLTIPDQKFPEDVVIGSRSFSFVPSLNLDVFVQPLAREEFGLSGMLVAKSPNPVDVFDSNSGSLSLTGQFTTTSGPVFLLVHGLFPNVAFDSISRRGYATLLELKPIDILNEKEDFYRLQVPDLETPRGYTGYIGFSLDRAKLLDHLSTFNYQNGESLHGNTSRDPKFKTLIDWRALPRGSNFRKYKSKDD